MSNDNYIFINSPQAKTPQGERLLKLAETLGIQWEREIVITGANDITLDQNSTATINLIRKS